MNAVDSSPQTRELSIWSVIGLTRHETEEWSRLRGLQYAQLAKVARARLLTQAMAALMTILLFTPVVGYGLIAGWLGALCGSLTYTTRTDWALGDTDQRAMTRQEFWRQALGTVINALVWSVPVVAFAPHAMIHLRFELWTVLAMLMTVSAVMLPTVPLATLLFSGIVGGASVAQFAFGGQPGMAVVSTLFVVSVGVGTISASRLFLMSRLAAERVNEGREVVRLLLREFDEDDANWLWLTDPQRRVRQVSRRFAEALGLAPEQIEGESLIKLISGPHDPNQPADPSLHALSERMKSRESFANLLVRVTVGGQPRWWELTATVRTDEDGKFLGYRGVASDVTDERETTQKITWLAKYDTLTGLPNRMMVTDALGDAVEAAVRGNYPCAFLMMDLDRFKAVNDTQGHPVGDQLLAAVAERLMALMDENALCGRLGGDEFCVVIRDASQKGYVGRLSRDIIASLSAPYHIGNHVLSIGASVGSALGPRDGSTVEEIMHNADFALYRAKQGGRGRHCAFDEGLHVETRARREMEVALRQAIENGELELAFQPEVNAGNDRIICLEALLRWNTREHGQLSPGRFLSLAEESRLILPIGEWVLEEACRLAAQWPANLRVAVNISGRQLLDPHFIDHVVKALSVSTLAPQRLVLEVRESAFQRDAGSVRAMLERVVALGCTVTLDDFGSGPSALTHLCELRYAGLKLDRGLIKGAAAGNPESVAMIRAAVALADNLEMTVTAKGVESETDLDVATGLGCGRIQGSCYGSPMRLSEVEQLFGRTEVLPQPGPDEAIVAV
ncbi:EAL domain-containing protein [Novosphingobium sp. FSY-8]|uniref:EAL domain-containing protein n=1 Tax=Novosphingobium ovatum TaxID=1908523 RepID=A0ABW9XAS2_9SPHN|nr:EAL domain-containing protein [Novosphingobium ovatum]NBC35621.1 EAL domain-containing protein [Novosphingobium ovatum]